MKMQTICVHTPMCAYAGVHVREYAHMPICVCVDAHTYTQFWQWNLYLGVLTHMHKHAHIARYMQQDVLCCT